NGSCGKQDLFGSTRACTFYTFRVRMVPLASCSYLCHSELFLSRILWGRLSQEEDEEKNKSCFRRGTSTKVDAQSVSIPPDRLTNVFQQKSAGVEQSGKEKFELRRYGSEETLHEG
ncbi:unnamed protein product, partial [Ectocarpus sp. 4 AP-2014]